MHLQLNRPQVGLQDGFASWNASAADALAIWNQYLVTASFVEGGGAGPAAYDGANSVFFSNTIYAEQFPDGVLAVTLNYSETAGTFTETDIIFNSSVKWNSYRGPIQGSGPTATWDFHRVALHEFGHVLGLDHPDQAGQNVTALMNSVISHLDQLSDDDIAGARSLYGARITSSLTPPSINLGASFAYQITATHNPTSFEASPLPSGLQLNPTTGLISGTPTVGGTFDVTIAALAAGKAATAILRIVVLGPTITSPLSPSGEIGQSFSYQITASRSASSFSATGLPPGLTLNSATGMISGIVELSGSYVITVTAHTAVGNATASFTLTVPARATPVVPVATYPYFPPNPRIMVADPRRGRVYIRTSSDITVIETASLQIVKKINISRSISDLSLSADGDRLWVGYGIYDPSNSLGSIDLDSLTALSDLPLDFKVEQVREGLEGRLYVKDEFGSVRQVDKTSGISQAPFSTSQSGAYLEISPDRRTLYIGDYGSAPNGGGSYLSRFDVSGPTPALLQRVNNLGFGGRALAVSPRGAYVTFVTVTGGISQLAASDLAKVYGRIAGPTGGPVAYSPDETQLFHGAGTKINIYNPANAQLLRAIDLNGNAYESSLLVDASGSYLFFVGIGLPGPTQLVVYSLGGAGLSSAPPKTLLNVSTRLRSQGGDNVLIGGFILRGSESKRVALRAIGPSLPLTGKLADPVLQLFDSSGAMVAENDNWNARRADVLATGIPPNNEREAVITRSLPPDSYTAVVRGVNGGSGVALVEAYDLASDTASTLANISTRGKVEAGDNVMIGGFILGGDQLTNIVVRAIGPSLANHGVVETLPDPVLEVYEGNGALLAQSDDWRMYQEQELMESGLAPTDDRESAVFLSLQPGAYTAIVRGKNESTGVGLVEVYNLERN